MAGNGNTRIVGCSDRLDDKPEVAGWTPPSRADVETMPAPPVPSPKGWTQSDLWPRAAQENEPARALESVPAATVEPVSTPSPSGDAGSKLPPGIGADSTQAFVWEHSEDASQLLRTWLHESEESTSRAAILVLALGREVASELLRRLSLSEIEQVTTAVATIQSVAHDLQTQVIDDFRQRLQSGQIGVRGGLEAARDILEGATGPRQTVEILDRIATQVSSGFSVLANVAHDQIAPYISCEHPQTIALILSQLGPAQAAGILSQLPEQMQPDVAHRISTMQNVTPEIIKAIEESLEQSLRDILSGDLDVGGPKVVADMLNWTGASVERNVLNRLDEKDPDTAESVRNLMFTFDDIQMMMDKDIQRLLREVDDKDLATALKAASPKLKEKFKADMSDEAWESIRQEMEELGPMWRREVEEVQLRIVQQVRQLEEKGEATIVRGYVPDQFV